MQKITVLHNQSLLDIAIQTTGKAENLLKIATENNLVPTEPLMPGAVLTIPDTVEMDTEIVKFYGANGIVPATALTEELQNINLTFWQKVVNTFR
jgi:hypothetical protein